MLLPLNCFPGPVIAKTEGWKQERAHKNKYSRNFHNDPQNMKWEIYKNPNVPIPMDHVRPSRISGPPKTGPFHSFRLSLCVIIYGSFCPLLFMFYIFPLIVQLMSVCVLLLFLDPDFIVASRLPSFCVHVVALGFIRLFPFWCRIPIVFLCSSCSIWAFMLCSLLV